MTSYLTTFFLIAISISVYAKDVNRLTSVSSELEIKSISSATIIYFPNGRQGKRIVGLIDEKETLGELLDILSVKKVNNTISKRFPTDIPQWIIYIHCDNGIHQLKTISVYLKHPAKGLLLEPKLFKLLQRKIMLNDKE